MVEDPPRPESPTEESPAEPEPVSVPSQGEEEQAGGPVADQESAAGGEPVPEGPEDAAQADQGEGAPPDVAELGEGPEPWVEMVQPFVDRLAAHLGQQGVKNHTVSLPVGAERLLVTPKEQILATTPRDAVGERCECLVRDAAGLKVKILADMRLEKRAEGLDKAPHRRELRRDVKAAQILAFELHRQARDLSRAGEFERAKWCTEYRRVLLATMDRATAIIGDLKDLSGIPAGAVVTSAAERGSTVRDDGAAEARARQIQARLDLRALRIRRLKIATAAVLPLILVVVVLRLWTMRPRELEHFSVHDFRQMPGLQMVVHREPLLIAVVSEPEWRKLSADKQKRAAQSLVDQAQRAGYRNVEVRADGGGILASWERGGKLTVR